MKKNKKITVIFLVNDYYVNNFITVYNLLKKNKKFNVLIVATDFIEIDGRVKNKSLFVRNYLENEGLMSIDYNNYDGTFLNIKEQNPDYIFYMTPYDIYFPYVYSTEFTSKYAKICHISYGANLIEWTGNYYTMNNNSFYDVCSMLFVESNTELNIEKRKIKVVGYVKLDDYLFYKKKNMINEKDRKKIVWKPRWTLEEGESNFFKYIDLLYEYFKIHSEVDFYIFFHQLFKRKIKEKNKTKKYNETIKKLSKLDNYYKCSYSNFLDEVWTSDILISDFSSTVAEFSRTGKPILFCESNIKLNELGRKLKDNSYYIKNGNELIEVLDMLLEGKDPKKESREKESKNYFYVPKNKTPSEYIVKILLNDYKGDN